MGGGGGRGGHGPTLELFQSKVELEGDDSSAVECRTHDRKVAGQFNRLPAGAAREFSSQSRVNFLC